jgi:autotransporter adhesin
MNKVLRPSKLQSRLIKKVMPAALAAGAVAIALPMTASAVTAPLIVNDSDFGSPDPGQCQFLSGQAKTTVGMEDCGTSATAGYNTVTQTGSVSIANASMSVGGYQFINGADTNNNALTISQAGANIQLNNGKVTNLAAGTANTDAVNFGQLKNTAQSTATAIGGGSALNSDGTISAPSFALMNANSINGTSGAATDVGTAFGTVDAALGKLNSNVTQNTADIANLNTGLANGTLGLVQQDPTTRTITVAKSTDGTVVDMTGSQGARTVTGVAPGAISASSLDAINGSQLYATNQNVAQNTSNIAQNTSDIAALNTNVAQNTSDISSLKTNVAQNSSDIAQNTSDISNINQQIASGNVGLVRQDATTQNITVAKDTGGTVVDMTGTDGTRTVTGVSAGALSADSTDAVNGSQLYQTNQNVSSLAQQLSNVEGAASTVASQKTDTPAVASGTDSTALGNGSKATGNNSVALGSGSVADEDNTVSIGSKGNERRLTNVAPGINGTDGVNMNQLNAVQSNVDTVARQAFSGVAAAMAMPNLTPSQPGKTVVAAGVANYKGYTAMGIGGTYRSRDSRWLVNAAASITPHGDAGVRGQVGYEF